MRPLLVEVVVPAVVEKPLSPWEAAAPCAELPVVECLPVLSAAARSYYRVLVAFVRVLSDFAALLRQAAACEFASGSLPDCAR